MCENFFQKIVSLPQNFEFASRLPDLGGPAKPEKFSQRPQIFPNLVARPRVYIVERRPRAHE